MLGLAAIQGRTTLAPDELVPLVRRLERPEPRVALGIALRGTASAMLDVSDGLTGDLRHILDASAVGARVDLERIPCAPALAARRSGPERELALACLLAGGDDYELLFTARNGARERVAAVGQEVGVPLTRIGKVTPPEMGLVVRAESGDALHALPRAFDHFAAPAAEQGGRA
jgi:thiamine-monophosphate kinase